LAAAAAQAGKSPPKSAAGAVTHPAPPVENVLPVAADDAVAVGAEESIAEEPVAEESVAEESVAEESVAEEESTAPDDKQKHVPDA